MIIDRLHPILHRFRSPAGEGGSDTGGSGAEDRGDSFTSTEDDDGAAAQAALAKTEAEKTAAKTAADKEAADKAAADEEEEEDGEGDDKKGKKDTRVPLSRHKEILEKERQSRADVEKKLAQYQNGDRIAATNEKIKQAEDKIATMDKEYTKLLTDGDHEKAATKRAEIRALENEIIEQKSDIKAQAASSRAIEKIRYDTTVDRLETAYPVLNPEHDDFNEESAQDVMDLASTYRAKGMTPAEAIQKAAKKLLGVETPKQTQATEVKARVDKDEAEAEAKRQAKEDERKATQVKKNLEANKQQPADTRKVGADTDKAGGGITNKDVMKMSQDDFNKLDEETLARMRGDVIGA